MATFHSVEITCTCGTSRRVPVAITVDVRRRPDLRAAILDGSFNRFECTNCQRVRIIESSFLYIDFADGLMIQVEPRGHRHRARPAAKSLQALAGLIGDMRQNLAEGPRASAPEVPTTLRVVTGLAELVEKIQLREAGHDDRALELVKALAIGAHPLLIKQPRLHLEVREVTEENVLLQASYDHASHGYDIRVPRRCLDAITAAPGLAEHWSSPAGAPPEAGAAPAIPASLVSIHAFSTGPDAVTDLLDLVAAITQGPDSVAPDDPDILAVLAALPAPDHMSTDAKLALHNLGAWAKDHPDKALDRAIILARYGTRINDEWLTDPDKTDVVSIWSVIDALPQGATGDGAYLKDIDLDSTMKYGGIYSPGTGRIDISPTELSASGDAFAHTLRHEIGHAYMDANAAAVKQWLEDSFGWKLFDADEHGFEALVRELGGWGTRLSELGRLSIKGWLLHLLSADNNWGPAVPGPFPPPVPWGWSPPDAPIVRALHSIETNSPAYWYASCDKWVEFNGQHVFLNYYYRKFMIVDAMAIAAVVKLPYSTGVSANYYAAMSDQEFFAELFAFHFDGTAEAVMPKAALDFFAKLAA